MDGYIIDGHPTPIRVAPAMLSSKRSGNTNVDTPHSNRACHPQQNDHQSNGSNLVSDTTTSTSTSTLTSKSTTTELTSDPTESSTLDTSRSTTSITSENGTHVQQAKSHIYVAGLPQSYTKIDVDRLFLPFGIIIGSRLLHTPDGQSRGIGFIRYQRPQHARAAIAGLHQTIPDKGTTPLVVKFASEPKTPRGVVLHPPSTTPRTPSTVASTTTHTSHAPHSSRRSSSSTSHRARSCTTPTPISIPSLRPITSNMPRITRTSSIDSHDAVPGGIVETLHLSAPSPAPSSSSTSSTNTSSTSTSSDPTRSPLGSATSISRSGRIRQQTNIYISSLPSHYTKEDMMELFTSFGTIVGARLLTDSSGVTRHSGFVRLHTHTAAKRAILHLHGIVPPRGTTPLICRFALETSTPRTDTHDENCVHLSDSSSSLSSLIPDDSSPQHVPINYNMSNIPNMPMSNMPNIPNMPYYPLPPNTYYPPYPFYPYMQPSPYVPYMMQPYVAIPPSQPSTHVPNSPTRHRSLSSNHSHHHSQSDSSPSTSTLTSTTSHSATSTARAATNIYISGLPIHYTTNDLMSLCTPYGVISKIRLLYHKDGTSRGIGFLRYTTHAYACTAIQHLNGVVLEHGSPPIVVKFAKRAHRTAPDTLAAPTENKSSSTSPTLSSTATTISDTSSSTHSSTSSSNGTPSPLPSHRVEEEHTKHGENGSSHVENGSTHPHTHTHTLPISV